jgi:hypothetical protein
LIEEKGQTEDPGDGPVVGLLRSLVKEVGLQQEGGHQDPPEGHDVAAEGGHSYFPQKKMLVDPPERAKGSPDHEVKEELLDLVPSQAHGSDEEEQEIGQDLVDGPEAVRRVHPEQGACEEAGHE